MLKEVYQLFDVVEMKKEHPCDRRTNLFQIVRMGADIKIKCQGCGNVIMLSREAFNKGFKRVVSHSDKMIEILK